MIKNGFIPTVLPPTRLTIHTCTLIDHIIIDTLIDHLIIDHLSRNCRINISSGNLMTDMSDHFAYFIILNSSNKSKVTDRPKVRIFSDKNKNTFKNLIGEIRWESKLMIRMLMNQCLFSIKRYLLHITNPFPFKRQSRKRAKDKPWVTARLKQSIKQRHILYQKYIFYQTEENKTAYKIFKNKLRPMIRKAEADYYKESFNSKTHNMKEMWKELSNLLHTNRKNKSNLISKLIVLKKELTNK